MNQAVTFTRAYSQYALDSPSRTSFLTGLRPFTTKVYDNLQFFRENMGANGDLAVTLPQHFKNNGYYVTGVGKVFLQGPSSGSDTAVGGGDESFSWSEDFWFCE